jgi:hypothetical protein
MAQMHNSAVCSLETRHSIKVEDEDECGTSLCNTEVGGNQDSNWSFSSCFTGYS